MREPKKLDVKTVRTNHIAVKFIGVAEEGRMLGLTIIGGALIAVVAVGMLLFGVAFWTVAAVIIGGILLILWSFGLFAMLGAITLFGAIGWTFYMLAKWDLGRLGQSKHVKATGWRLHRLVNREFGRPKADSPTVSRTPPNDPIEKHLWANRLGRYADDP